MASLELVITECSREHVLWVANCLMKSLAVGPYCEVG